MNLEIILESIEKITKEAKLDFNSDFYTIKIIKNHNHFKAAIFYKGREVLLEISGVKK